jgi:hypothetical protein
MKRLLAVFALTLIWNAGGNCRAGAIDPGSVAADAKWLVHIDFDALRESKVAQHAHEEILKHERAKEILAKVQDMTGMDPQKDLHGLTAYGAGFKPHSGVLIVYAHADRDKLLALMKSRPDFKTTSADDLELYSWTEGRGERKHDVIVAFPKEGVAVIAGSADQVKRASSVVRGGGGLTRSSPLIGDAPPETIFRLAAAGLGDAELPVKIDLLKKIERISIVAAEHDGTDFQHLRVVTTDGETAKQLKSIADGIKAMVDLHVADRPELKKIVDATKIEQDDKTLAIDWSGSSESVSHMLDKAHEALIKHIREHHAALDNEGTQRLEQLKNARERIRERRENRDGAAKDAEKKSADGPGGTGQRP